MASKRRSWRPRFGIIAGVTFDECDGILEVSSKDGEVTRYRDVPLSLFEGLLTAGNLARFIRERIDGRFKSERRTGTARGG